MSIFLKKSSQAPDLSVSAVVNSTVRFMTSNAASVTDGYFLSASLISPTSTGQSIAGTLKRKTF